MGDSIASFRTGTTFSEGLIEPFVKATTEKDDLVLDVFAGSGTTGVVALDLGRKFVGYEINGDFCEVCEQRLVSLNRVENTLQITPQFLSIAFLIGV